MRLRAILASLILFPSLAGAGDFFTLKGHGGPIAAIDVSPDGETILTASFDYSLGLWKDGVPTWLEAHRAGVNTVKFVNDHLAVSAGDDSDLYYWNLESRSARRLAGHKGKIKSVAVSPDGRRVASASWDRSIGIWPVDGGEPEFLTGHRSSVNDVVFSGDGSRLFSASADGTIRVWRLSDGAQVQTLVRHGFGVNTLAADFKNGWLAYGAIDGAARIVEIEDGTLIKDFTKGSRPILAMAADLDSAKLAVGDIEGNIRILDTEDWRVVREFRASLRGPIWALRFSADGSNIHAGGLDDAMYSWPVDTRLGRERMSREQFAFLRRPGEMTNGERQFQRKCSICHTLTPDSRRRAGPTLHGIFGRRAGELSGYNFSPSLRQSDIVWSAETIDQLFDLGPDHFIPGSKMPMQRIVQPQDRIDLIEYLRDAASMEN
ncbi:MAG: c-type cytochrome [Albidovulum sp.]|nr:c-type cytochrome [Albidovulum sp.]MDE0533131.1 c-type cytochrome [Albidovulum sp.]